MVWAEEEDKGHVCGGGVGSSFHFISDTGAGSVSSHHGAAICCIPH